jgi:hypothetical protein
MKKQVKLSVGRGEKLPASKGAGGTGSNGSTGVYYEITSI